MNTDIAKIEDSLKDLISTSTQTFYESQYLEKGKPITYVKFRIKY